ncbi:MAG: hypothetical protein ACJ8HI_17705 [Massilia sp.]
MFSPKLLVLLLAACTLAASLGGCKEKQNPVKPTVTAAVSALQ